MAHPGGRPKIYEDPAELEKAVAIYFFGKATDSGFIMPASDLTECIKTGITNKKPTISGLALFLGFADKTTLYEYRDRPEFSYPIKVSIALIEAYHEGRLAENNVTGAIFALKNMGWKDRTETDVTSGGEPISQPPSITIYNQGPPLKTDQPNDKG